MVNNSTPQRGTRRFLRSDYQIRKPNSDKGKQAENPKTGRSIRGPQGANLAADRNVRGLLRRQVVTDSPSGLKATLLSWPLPLLLPVWLSVTGLAVGR